MKTKNKPKQKRLKDEVAEISFKKELGNGNSFEITMGKCCDTAEDKIKVVNDEITQMFKHAEEDDEHHKTMSMALVDHTVIMELFKNEGTGKEVLQKLKTAKRMRSHIHLFTITPCFMRAIYLMDSKTSPETIKDVMDCVDIIPINKGNFKDEESVTEELMKVAKVATEFCKESLGRK